MRINFFKLLLLMAVLVVSGTNSFAQYEWTKYPANPLNIHGSPGSWNESVIAPSVIFNSDLNRYEMWFTAFWNYPNAGIGFAYSGDGITWTLNSTDPVMTPSTTGWDSLFVGAVCILKEGGTYKMWYTGWKSTTRYPHSIGYATSPNGINWTKHPDPVLSPLTGWESGAVGYPSVIKIGSSYVMFYTGEVSAGVALTGRAISTDGINWQRYANNPVLPAGGAGTWDRNNYLAKVIELNNTLYLYYTAEDNPGVSGTAIGFATSVDSGKTWTKYSGNPMLTRGTTGSWDNGWIEMGGVLFAQNELKLYYDGGGATTGNRGRVGLATSEYVVPVELTSFMATTNGKEVILNWSTATELNNQGFEVQRKFGSNEFVTVGLVKGHGTTTSPNNYTYVDKLTAAGKYFYRLKQIDFGGKYEYSQTVEVNWSPFTTYKFEQNYPNPFNPTTKIKYFIPEVSFVTIKVYDVLGNEVSTLVNEEKPDGTYEITWYAEELPSGVYFYQLKATPSGGQAGNFVETKKMILLK